MKNVIEMAREAGFNKNELAYLGDNFTRLADLVRADEREALAKAMHAVGLSEHISKIAEAIRART